VFWIQAVAVPVCPFGQTTWILTVRFLAKRGGNVLTNREPSLPVSKLVSNLKGQGHGSHICFFPYISSILFFTCLYINNGNILGSIHILEAVVQL
jgi:hypothetical protein